MITRFVGYATLR